MRLSVLFGPAITAVVLGVSAMQAIAGPADDRFVNWNFELVGEAVLPDGELVRNSFSKLAPWPMSDGNTLYSGCYEPTYLIEDKQSGLDRCFFSVDLSDPARPVILARVFGFDLERSPSPPPNHIIWHKDYPFPNLPVSAPCKVDWLDAGIAQGHKPPPCWDPGWNTHNISVALTDRKVLAVNLERYRGGTDRQVNYRGVKFYDVSDPARPRFLSYWEAPASPPDPEKGVYPDMLGTHHFNFDESGRFLYLGTEYEGYIGRILVILDVADPTHPVEASRWWQPGQKTPEEDAIRTWEQPPFFSSPIYELDNGKLRKFVGMHYVTVYGNKAYLAYHQAGLVILDVADPYKPKLLAHHDYLVPGAEPRTLDTEACRAAAGGRPAACGNAHSAKLLAGNDKLLVMTDEYFECPFGHLRIFDVSDPREPKIVSHFGLPENTACDPDNPTRSNEPWRYHNRGPSTHMANSFNSATLFVAWYGAGIRAIDVSDPARPREIGRYIYSIKDKYSDVGEYTSRESYDIVLGPKNLLYVADGTAGLWVFRYTGEGLPPVVDELAQ